MGTPPAHGLDLIAEIMRQKNNRDAFEIYYFAHENGVNKKHDSYLKLFPEEAPKRKRSTRTERPWRTAKEIFEEVHRKMKGYVNN